MPSPMAASSSTAPPPGRSSPDAASEAARDLAQLAFGELAARRSGQGVEDLEPLGPQFLAGAALLEVRNQRLECQPGPAGAQLDEHADPFAEGLVGHRDRGAERDGGMRPNLVFHLRGADVLAAADD